MTSLFTYPSSPSDHLTANILEDDEFVDSYISTNQARLTESYDFTTKFFKEHGIPYYPGSNAAFFVWVDLKKASRQLRPTSIDEQLSSPINGLEITEDIMSKLLEKGVFLASGEAFGSEEAGWFRIVFSQPREYVQEGLKRILEIMSDRRTLHPRL